MWWYNNSFRTQFTPNSDTFGVNCVLKELLYHFVFENEARNALTVTTQFFVPQFEDILLYKKCGISRTVPLAVTVLHEPFRDRVFSCFDDQSWSRRSCDLTPMDILWRVFRGFKFMPRGPRTPNEIPRHLCKIIIKILARKTRSGPPFINK